MTDVSITTTPVDRYTTIDPLPTVTGSDAQKQFARMMARLAARYRLSGVPGRPEELVSPETTDGPRRGVSLAYSGRTIRVRLMADRAWIRVEDFQVQEGWHARLYQMCDTYFDYAGPDTVNRKLSTLDRLS